MTRRLRVAQVISTNMYAGAERYVTNLAPGLARHDWEVVVIGGEQRRMTEALAGTGVKWRPGTSVIRCLRSLSEERPFDIVHAHMTAAELASVLAAPVTRAPIVATRHFAQRRGSTPSARVLGRFLTTRLAAQLAISDFVARRTEGTSTIVTPGTAKVAERGDEHREKVVLVAQRLDVEKRTDLAIRAWASSGLGVLGWRLDIAGAGKELDRLRALAEELGVSDSCRFMGVQPNIESHLRRAAILLAPRPDEPYGLSVVEAMAAGLPVVAAAGGGHLETVGTVDGAVLYPPADSAAAGRMLAALAHDARRREVYGATLRAAHRRSFTLEAQTSETLDVYRSVLSGA